MSWIVLALLAAGPLLVQSTQPDTVENYLMGTPDSPVRIEIFSDFQCPGCRTFFLDTISPLMEQYAAGNKVAVIFHDFPLPAHASAKTASLYSMASKSLGQAQFIKVINYLYTCQAEWSYDGNVDRVVSRALTPDEMARVREKLKDPAVGQTIEREIAMGNKRKVESTPTFFVTLQGKEQRVVGGLSYPLLNAFIAPSLK